MSSPPSPAAIPDGLRIYAIGDIHGRADLLERLYGHIRSEGSDYRALIVLLGDYVDRGPHSAAVLNSISSDQAPGDLVTLRGNHEAMFLDFLSSPETMAAWRNYGGLETLHSYGIPVNDVMRGSGYETARDRLLDAIPPAHLNFLSATPLSVAIGDYFFCHAGIRPGVPLEDQSPQDLMSIREEFLSHRGDFGKIIVHGHTPVDQPDMRPNRINIDTGAFMTGRLSCLVLEGDQRRFITT